MNCHAGVCSVNEQAARVFGLVAGRTNHDDEAQRLTVALSWQGFEFVPHREKH